MEVVIGLLAVLPGDQIQALHVPALGRRDGQVAVHQVAEGEGAALRDVAHLLVGLGALLVGGAQLELAAQIVLRRQGAGRVVLVQHLQGEAERLVAADLQRLIRQREAAELEHQREREEQAEQRSQILFHHGSPRKKCRLFMAYIISERGRKGKTAKS